MDIYEKLYSIISEHFAVGVDTINPETEFVADLGADSLDVVELILGVETAFDLPEIQEDDIIKLLTIENLADYILGKIDY
jgi:Acyl carrier protein